nr:deoxyribodipyrimidine photo-lyase [Kiloniella laminariae]
MPTPVIHWFRRDLRLADNPALFAASQNGSPVILLYVHDDTTAGDWTSGAASNWWLHHSLQSLTRDLAPYGNRLVFRTGPAVEVVRDLALETKASAVFFTRCYEPWSTEEERMLAQELGAVGIAARRFGGNLLFEPESLKTGAQHPFKIYTPFYKAALKQLQTEGIKPRPEILLAPESFPPGDDLASWQLCPAKPDWSSGLAQNWQPGEQGAEAALEHFIDGAIDSYGRDRDWPGIRGTSRLSPHLHFGEISPRVCWHHALTSSAIENGFPSQGAEVFLKELVWREFSHHLLHHNPDLPTRPFREKYAAFPWRRDKTHLAAWQRGLTGYPLVDAGMRELWHSGWMHNRVRMITASFLIKHLLIDWREGQKWFWDTLVDADLANNAASWQWVAGCGADAAPYFRIFNPVLQGERFDPEGSYIKRWLPELARLPAKYIHAPWQAPASVLKQADITLGKDYPHPIVDHSAARNRALAALKSLESLLDQNPAG